MGFRRSGMEWGGLDRLDQPLEERHASWTWISPGHGNAPVRDGCRRTPRDSTPFRSSATRKLRRELSGRTHSSASSSSISRCLYLAVTPDSPGIGTRSSASRSLRSRCCSSNFSRTMSSTPRRWPSGPTMWISTLRSRHHRGRRRDSHRAVRTTPVLHRHWELASLSPWVCTMKRRRGEVSTC